MSKFSLSHEINCNVETFWKIFLDKDFNDKLYKEALGFPAFAVVDQKESDTAIVRKAEGQPKMNVPGPVAKVLGSNFRYTEEGKFDKATKTWTWKMTPSTLADKMKNEGKVHVEAIGENKVRRVCEILIEAKVFAVGGILESTAEKQMREGWDTSAAFMNKWLETHGG